MTLPKPPSGTTPGKPADSDAPKRDALDGLPPMPKTRTATDRPAGEKPAKDKPARHKPAGGKAGSPGGAADDSLDALGKKELFARVKARTGRVKGSEVREVIDVVLDELGAALVAGEALKLPALGTMKVQRRKTQDGADVVVCKLRRKKHQPKPKDPLAKPAEGS